MNNASAHLLDRGFPFRISDFDLNGNPFQVWDGTTYYRDIYSSTFGPPSASESVYIPVVGQGTERPLGYTLAALARWYYVQAWLKASWSITEVRDFTYFGTTEPDTWNSEWRQASVTVDSATHFRNVAEFPPTTGYEGSILEKNLFQGSHNVSWFGDSPTINNGGASKVTTTTIARTRWYSPVAGATPTWMYGPGIGWGPWREHSDIYGGPATPWDETVNDGIIYLSRGAMDGSSVSMSQIAPVIKVGDLYYPVLSFNPGSLSGNLSTVRRKQNYEFWTGDPDDWRVDNVSDVTFTFLGNSITLYDNTEQALDAFVESDGGLTIKNAFSLTGSITIEPHQHWPWGGRFSQTTGEYLG